MASGYVTADGKDLDSRYLAIGAKAVSASSADSVHWNNVAGKPSMLSTSSFLQHIGASIIVDVQGYKSCTYSAPSSGMFFGHTCTGATNKAENLLNLYVNGHLVKEGADRFGVPYVNGEAFRAYFLCKGQTIIVEPNDGSKAYITGYFIPSNIG